MGSQLTLVLIDGTDKAEKARELLTHASIKFHEVDIRHNGAAPYLSRDFGPGVSLPLLVVDGTPISGLEEIRHFAQSFGAGE